MRAGALALVLGLAGCASSPDGGGRESLERGRTYTGWLYTNQYEKLWNRFSPEMRRTFGSTSDLASFAGRAVRRLGPERGKVDEQVERPDGADDRVYTRIAAFTGAPARMLIQWTLTRDGAVTGLLVRPAVADSSAAARPAAQ